MKPATKQTFAFVLTSPSVISLFQGYRILKPDVLAVDETQAAGVIVPEEIATKLE